MIHNQTYKLPILKGSNKLLIRAQGEGDGYGATIDNILIKGDDGSRINVMNGDFETPHQGHKWNLV